MNIITIKQINQLFRTFASNHPFINSFGIGETSEISTTSQTVYPLMWVSNVESTILTANKTLTPQLNYRILFLDKITDITLTSTENGDVSNNGEEVSSDTFQYLTDLILHINQNWTPYGIILDSDVQCEPVIDELPDKVGGWSALLTFKTIYVNCSIPV